MEVPTENQKTGTLKWMTTNLLCAYPLPVQDGFPCFFSKTYDCFDCQPFTTKQSTLSTVGYFGNVVCKGLLSPSPLFQIISTVMFFKISNAKLMCYLGFSYMVNVFAIVQALSLGAMECLWVILLYGLEFRTARELMFDLGRYKEFRYIFPSFRHCTDMEKCGKWNRSWA